MKKKNEWERNATISNRGPYEEWFAVVKAKKHNNIWKITEHGIRSTAKQAANCHEDIIGVVMLQLTKCNIDSDY